MAKPILSEPVTLSEPMAWVDVAVAVRMMRIEAQDVVQRTTCAYAREKAESILKYAVKAERSIDRLDPYRGTTHQDHTHEQVAQFRLEKDGER